MPCRSTARDKLILKIHGTVLKSLSMQRTGQFTEWKSSLFAPCDEIASEFDCANSPIYYSTAFQFVFFITRILQWHYGERLNSKRYDEFFSCSAAGSWSLEFIFFIIGWILWTWLDRFLWNCMAVLLYTLRPLIGENYNGTTERRILVVYMAHWVGNQSERSKDNRPIVLEGHVTH